MKLRNLSYFKLEKLYLDSIDDSGNCFVIYYAKLEFFFVRITFSELIFSDASGMTIEKKSLKKISKPLTNDLLLYFNHFMQIRGSWKRTSPPLMPISFKDKLNRELIWNCHHPKAFTEIEHEESKYRGFGYAETISMTIKPWILPMEELRWGRFLSDDFTITWIEWKGDYPLHKIFCNGTEYKDAIFESQGVVFGRGAYSLIFKEITIIRKGKLSKVFSKMPWLKIIFNKRILNTTEIKYKAKSILNLNSETKATGWSLYELIIWGK
jgi:hypothetical protein